MDLVAGPPKRPNSGECRTGISVCHDDSGHALPAIDSPAALFTEPLIHYPHLQMAISDPFGAS